MYLSRTLYPPRVIDECLLIYSLTEVPIFYVFISTRRKVLWVPSQMSMLSTPFSPLRTYHHPGW